MFTTQDSPEQKAHANWNMLKLAPRRIFEKSKFLKIFHKLSVQERSIWNSFSRNLANMSRKQQMVLIFAIKNKFFSMKMMKQNFLFYKNFVFVLFWKPRLIPFLREWTLIDSFFYCCSNALDFSSLFSFSLFWIVITETK